MIALNCTTGRVLAATLDSADSLWHRLKGLIGTSSLAEGGGLWIKPCSSIHTIGMRFPIDVLFLDRTLRVVEILPSLPPNRLTRIRFRAASVLELPSGTVERTVTKAGDFIAVR